jgi:hypothetical protein
MGPGRSRRKAAEDAFYRTILEVLHCISQDGLLILPSTIATSAALVFPHTLPRLPAELSVVGGRRIYLSVEHSYALVEV